MADGSVLTTIVDNGNGVEGDGSGSGGGDKW